MKKKPEWKQANPHGSWRSDALGHELFDLKEKFESALMPYCESCLR